MCLFLRYCWATASSIHNARVAESCCPSAPGRLQVICPWSRNFKKLGSPMQIILCGWKKQDSGGKEKDLSSINLFLTGEAISDRIQMWYVEDQDLHLVSHNIMDTKSSFNGAGGEVAPVWISHCLPLCFPDIWGERWIHKFQKYKFEAKAYCFPSFSYNVLKCAVKCHFQHDKPLLVGNL